MSWLSPARWLLIGAVIAALLTVWQWREHVVDKRGYDRAVSEYTAKAIIAEQAARSKEQAMQATTTKAIQDAQARQTKLQADATTARRSVDGLRNDLAAARSQLSTVTRDALERYASTASTVLDQCASRYQAVAEDAGRLADNQRTLIEAWPK